MRMENASNMARYWGNSESINLSTWASSKNRYSKSGWSRRKLVVAALGRSGRSALLSVCMIRLGIFSVIIIASLHDHLSAPGANVQKWNWPSLLCRVLSRQDPAKYPGVARHDEVKYPMKLLLELTRESSRVIHRMALMSGTRVNDRIPDRAAREY